MYAHLNGSLDGLELDNTDDVIEKSLVIGMVKELKALLEEAKEEMKNIPTKIMEDESDNLDRCKKCNEPLLFAMGSLFCPNPNC